MKQCSCDNSTDYAACCGRFISGNAVAETPEQLMRSRYSAYSMANIDYIVQTMRGTALQGFDKQHARQWAQAATWQGLQVVHTEMDADKADVGYVEFIAKFQLDGQNQQIHEKSRFKKYDGRWYYVDGKKIN